MKGAKLKRMIDLHAWLGVACGLALFVAFYAGALNVFHHQLQHWQQPGAAAPTQDLDAFLAQVTTDFPAARERLYLLPDENPGVMWLEPSAEEGGAGEWRTVHAADYDAEGRYQPSAGAEVADFINELHYQLGLPSGSLPINIGMTLMGLVAVLYGVALVSGLLIHLPKLGKELLALRHQGNLRRYWKNMHNLVGVLSLPFHLIMSVTGAAMGTFVLVAALLGVLVFGPQLQGQISQEMEPWPAPVLAGEAQPMALVADYLSAAENEVPGLEVAWIEIRGYGDRAGWLDVAGSVPGYLGHHAHVVLDVTMAPLRVVAPGQRSGNAAALSLVYALHFGDYGGLLVQGLYFVLGMLGALLFVSGNILWCERRCDKVGPSRASALLLRLTLGVCFGVMVGLAMSLLMAALLLHTPLAAGVAWAERGVFWLTLLALVLWSVRASPLRFAGQLWRWLPLTYLLVPLAQLLLEGRAAWQGDKLVVNLALLLMALVFWGMARHFRYRQRIMEPHPLWVGQVTGSHPLQRTDAEQGEEQAAAPK